MRSIMNAVNGYNRDKTEEFRGDWHRARFIAAWSTMKKVSRVEDIIKFPWEQKTGDKSGFDALRSWAKSMNNKDNG